MTFQRQWDRLVLDWGRGLQPGFAKGLVQRWAEAQHVEIKQFMSFHA